MYKKCRQISEPSSERREAPRQVAEQGGACVYERRALALLRAVYYNTACSFRPCRSRLCHHPSRREAEVRTRLQGERIPSLLLEEKVLNASEADEVTDAEHPLKSKWAKNHLIDLIIKEKR